MIKGIIIAGDYNQYINYLKENKLQVREYKYAWLPEHLLGIHAPIFYVGEYWLNRLTDSPELKILEVMNNNG